MTVINPIKIKGLAEFSRDLRKIQSDLPKGLRLAANEAAGIVVARARPKVARRSGKAAGTIRSASTRTEGRVMGGGSRAPYYPWLDFGGRVGRKRSVHRAFLPGGRYIYASYGETREQVYAKLIEALIGVVEGAGVAVDGK